MSDRLEYLSDEVRKGHPVSISEALEVIEYQNKLKANKKQSLWKRFLNWCKTTIKIGNT